MAQSFDTSLKRVAINYIRLLGAKVTESSIKGDLESNPYYPTLLSLSDTFKKYNIRSTAFNVGKEDFNELEAPFVAFVTIPGIGNDFVLVTDISETTISYVYKANRSVLVNKGKFLEQYQNMIWVADPDEDSGERNYEIKYLKEKHNKLKKRIWFAGLLTIVIILVGLNLSSQLTFSFVAIVLLKLLGVAITVMLLVYEIDNNNAFIKSLCSTGLRTNCDAVVNSKAAKIAGVSWGEIGFYYFLASFLILITPAFSLTDKIMCIAIANILSLPYILFSLFYQWRIVKQWCPLCLSIQLLLLSEFIWNCKYYWFKFDMAQLDLRAISGINVILDILVPVIFWYGIKAIILKAKDADLYLAAFQRLQYNPDIFSGLLLQQQKASDGWIQLGISLGNPNAKNTIVKVCNPYCGPCASMHPRLERIIKENSNINLRVIFTSKNSTNDQGAIVVRHLLAIASEGDIEKTMRALDDWYSSKPKSYENFSKKYPLNGELAFQSDKIEAMSRWCSQTEIMYTPTIFVNGYLLPGNYNIDELQSIL
jgi:thiol-disulfide isomerase/thioredoxin/uncharacterized membrane protein